MGRLARDRLPGRQPALVPVRVSAAHARHLFHGCDPEYITNVCHGACCTLKTTPLVVVVTEAEGKALRGQYGRRVVAKGKVTTTPDNHCPFQGGDSLCTVHTTLKPTSCHESPWTLTKRNTLIVRNRYRRLVCFTRDGLIPAYQAFADGLVRLFGADEAARIIAHLEGGGGDIMALMPLAVYQRVRVKNAALKGLTNV